MKAPSAFYDPLWLVLALNAVFVTAVCLAVAVISMRNYMATGRLQILLLGCGVLALSIGGTASAYAIGLPNGANIAGTIHNTGAFAAAFFHFISAIVLISAFSGFRPKQKSLWLFTGYSGVIIFMILLTLAAFKGLAPLFFIQGGGPTMLRQAVLGSAAVLFAFSFLVFMLTYQKNKEIFLYWYSLALSLNSICFIAVFIQNSVGSPVGWVCRISQYLGGIYFLIAIISAIRSAGERRTSFDDVITSSLRIVEEKLRESEERYRSLFENINEGFTIGEIIYDETGKAIDYRFIDANPAFEMFIGFPRDQIIGKTIRSILPNVQSKAIEIFGKIDKTGKDIHFENYSRDLNMWFDIYAYSLMPGKIAYLALDITERKRAEEKLMESEVSLRSLAENVPCVLMRSDRQLRVVYLSKQSDRYNPNPAEQMTDRTNREMGMPEHLCDLWDEAIVRVFSTGTQEEMEFDFAGPSGMRAFSLKFAPEFGPDGHEVRYVLGVSSDITERKHAEKALLKAREELEQRIEERTAELKKRTRQLQGLMLELTNAENRERKRLAIILHDHLQQILVGAKLGNETVQRQISDNELRKSVRKVSDLLDESIKVSRTLTTELSPPILHEGGLVPGLQWLARWFEEKQGFKVSIIADADIPPDPGGISILLFQTIRELLFNAVKHAKINEALVEVSKTDGDILHIIVEDKGAGFNVQEIKNSGPDAGFGLFSIRERIDILGGQLNIDSAPGAGTRITMTVPMPSGTGNGKDNILQGYCICYGRYCKCKSIYRGPEDTCPGSR